MKRGKVEKEKEWRNKEKKEERRNSGETIKLERKRKKESKGEMQASENRWRQ